MNPSAARRGEIGTMPYMRADSASLIAGGSFFRHRIPPTNVGRNRHVRRRLVSVRAGTARREHRWAEATEAGGGAAQRAFPHQFKRFPAEPPAAPRGRSLPSIESERAPRCREQQSPPPPIEAMRCRSEATKSQRCAVGKRLASGRRESAHFFGTLGGIIGDLTTRSLRRVASLPVPTEFHWPTYHIHRAWCAPALLHDADAAGPLDRWPVTTDSGRLATSP